MSDIEALGSLTQKGGSPEMHPRLKALHAAIKWRTLGRRAAWALFVSFVIWAGSKGFKQATGTDEEVWDFVIRRAPELMRLPVGFVLLMFLAWIGLLVTVVLLKAWRETLPPKAVLGAPTEPAVPVVSPEELELVRQIRTAWLRYGCDAMDSLRYLFDLLVRSMPENDYRAMLLSEKVKHLETAIESLRSLLATEVDNTLQAVRDAFNQTYAKYYQSSKWIAKLAEAGDVDLGAELNKRPLNKWREAHRVFIERLRDLNTIPGHAGTLFFEVSVMADDSLKAFLREAEYPDQAQREKERQLELLLRQLSEDEKQFLMLLSETSITYAQPGTARLPHAVRQAGLALARKGVFAYREVEVGGMMTDLFTVPRDVAEVLARTTLQGLPVRDEIRLRWDRCDGSGASGGGAQPSSR